MVKFFAFITAIIVFFEGLFGGAAVSGNKKTDFQGCKNVIFMIGDGMGFNSIAKTKAELGLDSITMDTFPLQGESKTRSANNKVTDSAAGGSALATGVRIDNSSVAVYPYDKTPYATNPMSLTELAIEQGKAAGVITTDSTSGATPASFSAHSSDRDNENDITTQQMKNEDLTVMWGTATASFSADIVYEYGWTDVITDKASMDALEEGSRSFGQFSDAVWHTDAIEGMPTIAEMTAKAIDLVDDDEDGFFLMVEGAHIDKNSHKNNGEGMKDALIAFDQAIAVALNYAKTHGDTLVVITADHETGGITLKNGNYEYTKTSHSGVNVPLLVYGCDNFINNGEAIENREVSRRVACVMGETDFPRRVTAQKKDC